MDEISSNLNSQNLQIFGNELLNISWICFSFVLNANVFEFVLQMCWTEKNDSISEKKSTFLVI